MAERDIIMASQSELKRLHVIHKILDRELKQVEAKDVLNLSDRQIFLVTIRSYETTLAYLLCSLFNVSI